MGISTLGLRAPKKLGVHAAFAASWVSQSAIAGRRIVLVASQGGRATNPMWYLNLKADPKLTLQDGDVTKEYVAREIEGEEYDSFIAFRDAP